MKHISFENTLLFVFYVFFSTLMAYILILSLLRPQNYLIPRQMIPVTILVSVLLFVLAFLWKKLSSKIQNSKHPKTLAIIYPILLFLFFSVLYTIGMLHGDHHTTGDYEILYVSASEMAKRKPLTYYHYFLVYGNNTQPMILLSVLIRISNLLPIGTFPFLLLLSTSLVTGSIHSVNILLGDSNKQWRIPVLLFAFLCLPIYIFTSAFYTDTMSFGIGIIVLALLKTALQKTEFNFKSVIYCILAAIFTFFGIAWKITSIIPLIAATIVFLIQKKGKLPQNGLKKIIIFVTSFLALYLAAHFYFSAFSIYRDSKEYSNPNLAWVALGMRNDGSYAQNVAFSDDLNALTTKEEKNAFIKTYMKEHLSEAFTIRHFIDKTQHNFSGGKFTSSDFTAVGEHERILYEMMDPGGKYYWKTSQITFCYIALIYLFYLLGGIYGIIFSIKNKKISAMKIMTDISFVGIFLFLMIWESNNRQLYNQVPLFWLALFINLVLFMNFPFFSKKKDSL